MGDKSTFQSWGVGIFDNSTAQDVRKDFEAAMAAGASAYSAADALIVKYDSAGSCALYLALAALQLEQNVIQPKIKKKALTLIISGEASEDWEAVSPAIFENRKAILHELRQKLLAMPT